MVRTSKRGVWWSAVDRKHWPDDPDWRRSMMPYFDPVFGDRRQEIVFIGVDPMDEAWIRDRLDACLVGLGGRVHAEAWRGFRDRSRAGEREAA